MKEIKRIKKVMSDLFNGEPWLDVNIEGTLRGITAAKAAFKYQAGINSIWEITNHMIWWRLNIMARMSGKIITTPEHNYFLLVTDESEDNWVKTIERFTQSRYEWNLFLDELRKQDLNIIYPVNGFSFYDHLMGIIQHDAYHLGQIVLLSKHFSASPITTL